jgi:hypothetical protein
VGGRLFDPFPDPNRRRVVENQYNPLPEANLISVVEKHFSRDRLPVVKGAVAAVQVFQGVTPFFAGDPGMAARDYHVVDQDIGRLGPADHDLGPGQLELLLLGRPFFDD